jgi:uncharacterized protein (DUF111 family)
MRYPSSSENFVHPEKVERLLSPEWSEAGGMSEAARSRLITLVKDKIAMADEALASVTTLGRAEAVKALADAATDLIRVRLHDFPFRLYESDHELARLQDEFERCKEAVHRQWSQTARHN